MDIYKDIASRTNGEIYIGVVGPVRTGKSTFIKRFMDLCVIPYMEEGHMRERTIDELPQSSQGKTIMTTEPKFIPQNGVSIRIDDNQEVKVRLVDCVGFVVEGANGHMEGDGQRMVRTPWFAEEIPFEDAAKIGTLKVIKEHATIGVVVTTDGSFSEISRENYINAEEQTIAEMEETRKPYVILLNSERPFSAETQQLKTEMEAKYNRPVIAINCKQMQKSDIVKLLESVLLEFPVSQVEFYIPKWTEMLSVDNEIKQALIRYATEWMERTSKMRDLYREDVMADDNENTICKPFVRKIRTSDGTVELRIDVDDKYYFDFLSNITGMPITSEYQMISMIKNLSAKKREYEKVEDAIDSVGARGYGVVTPALADITMEEPELITHAGKYGVKIRANSPSIHMIKANIETEIAPIVGSKEQAEDLIAYIKDGEGSVDGLWSANIFGKSLGELMEDGIRDKISKMDDECQTQLQN
ncbi:MAG: stage IV sporulation protein A, partial [Agathobacter sp.]|nr:stage IV sporulation protein A [Agathobacter sp.]